MQLRVARFLYGPQHQPNSAWGSELAYDASREHPFRGEMHEWRYWHEIDVAQEEFVECIEQPTGPNYIRAAMRLYVGRYIGGAIIYIFQVLFSVSLSMIALVNNILSLIHISEPTRPY